MNADAFIRAETAVAALPFVPEIRLHLASEVTPLWQATEAHLARDGLAPPYWAFAWPGGQALARLILDRPDLVRGRSVLDFAAGSGIAAIAAARAGAASVAASEIDPMAAACIRLNAALNDASVAVLEEDLTARGEASWEIVLAGDVCYEKPMAERVWPFLRRLAETGATVLLADPGRTYLPGSGLAAFATYAVPTLLELEDSDMRETVVWRVVPASSG